MTWRPSPKTAGYGSEENLLRLDEKENHWIKYAIWSGTEGKGVNSRLETEELYLDDMES